MSRTRRRFRKNPHAGRTYRDGQWQYHTSSCERHGGCPYCLRDRTHGTERRRLLGTGE